MQALVIFAKNVQRVSAFYQKTLGLSVAEADDGHELLTDPSTELVIHAIPSNIANSINISKPPAMRENTALKPVFHVQDLEHVRRAATDAGGGLKPASSAWEIRGAHVLDGWDPEGNVVQFKEPKAS